MAKQDPSADNAEKPTADAEPDKVVDAERDKTVGEESNDVEGAEPATEAEEVDADETDAHPTVETPWGKVIANSLIAVAIVSLVMLAFILPNQVAQPRNIPVGVVASEKDYNELSQQLEQIAQQQGNELPMKLERVDDKKTARQSVEKAETLGALVLPSAPGKQFEAYVTTAGNAQVANMIASMAQNLAQMPVQMAQMQGKKVSDEEMQAAMAGPRVQDVVQLAETDQQGAGLTISTLPLVIGGLLGGVLIALRVRGRNQRMMGVLVYSVVGGAVLAFLLRDVFGLLPAPFVGLWCTVALALAATQALVVGLHKALGGVGIGLAAVLTLLIGNPISGAQIPWQFLPSPIGQIGQFLVPGASTTLLKYVSYFPKANLLVPLLVLVAWTVVGLALILFSPERPTRREDVAAGEGTEDADGEATDAADTSDENAAKAESQAVPVGSPVGAQPATQREASPVDYSSAKPAAKKPGAGKGKKPEAKQGSKQDKKPGTDASSGAGDGATPSPDKN